MPSLKKFGQACWDQEKVSAVITNVAKTSLDTGAVFLASHSPFKSIIDRKSAGRKISEEDLFNDIFASENKEIQAFVKGEPGTGKSHLIRWIKERSLYERKSDAKHGDNWELVFVSRGNGSLKDALAQIVSQLGKQYTGHVDKIKNAIESLSEETARAKLLNELALEIEQRWERERGREALDVSIRDLGEALLTGGFRKWFLRSDGVVDKVIQRLINPSSVDEREEDFPEFEKDELTTIHSQYLRPENTTQQVRDFAEDLIEEPDTCELACEVLNIALKDAIRSLTGLSGNDLLDIFTDIRRQIGPNKNLVVFIEDVSVTGLDIDVINAFEPRHSEGLCRMVAVLGITENGWEKLPDNLHQRATHIFEVGGQNAEDWSNNIDEVAKFTARYLNTLRCSDQDINDIANDRFTGDIKHSYCTSCAYREECHSAFGKVAFDGGVEVGLFPFTKDAPQALLQGLTDVRYPSQRYLLDNIITRALDTSYQDINAQKFPRMVTFPVDTPSITGWTGFENKYCGGTLWDKASKLRIHFLANYWICGTKLSKDQIAGYLKPMLKPLGLPDFSSKAEEFSQDDRKDVIAVEEKPPVEITKTDHELDKLTGYLNDWFNSGAALKEDSKFRELLHIFIKKSIKWEDNRNIPYTEVKRCVSGKEFPKIEGQIANPKGLYTLDFPRDEETKKVIEALLLLEKSENKTWGFEDGEIYKRNLSRWLRKNKKNVFESIDPDPKSLSTVSLRCAIQALALSAVFRDRNLLPTEPQDRLNALFKPCWNEFNRPQQLSKELKQIVGDLESRNSKLREFVVFETGVGQGKAIPSDFIDPVPILECLKDFEINFKLSQPDSRINDSFWKKRLASVKGFTKEAYKSLEDKFLKENIGIKSVLLEIKDFTTQAGYEDKNLSTELTQCLRDLSDLILIQRGHGDTEGVLPLPSGEFDEIWCDELLGDEGKREAFLCAISEASDLVEKSSDYELVSFDPIHLLKWKGWLQVIKDHLTLIEREISTEEKQVGGGGNSRSDLLEELRNIASYKLDRS